MVLSGNANKRWWSIFEIAPPQQKILKIPPQNFGKNLVKQGKLRNLG